MPRRRDEYDDDYDRPRRRRRDEDSDDEDDDPRPAKPGSGATIVMVLAGTVVACLLICGGIGVYIYRSVARGVDAARQDVQQQVDTNLQRMKEEGERREAQRKKDEEAADRTQAKKLADQFLAEAKGGRAEAAYALTTADFQKRVPLAEFQKQTGPLATRDGRAVQLQAAFGAPAAGTTFTFENFGGLVTVNLTVVKDDGRWLVDRFSAGRTGGAAGDDENSDKGKATKAMEQFVAELKADRADAAYKLTTADHRKRVSPDEFKKQARALGGPDSGHLNMRADFWAPASGGTYSFDGNGAWGLTVKLTVVKDGERWLVDRLTVTKPNMPGRDDPDSDKGQAFKLAEQFVAELKAGRPDAAYALASPAFRKRVPLAEFKGGTRPFTGIHSHVIHVRRDVTAPADGTTYGFDVDMGFGNVAKLTAVSAGGKWQVDQFILPKVRP